MVEMVTTHDQALRDSLTMRRVHGSCGKYTHESVGVNRTN